MRWSFLNRDALSLSFCMLVVACFGCLALDLSWTRFMNPLTFWRSSSSIIIRLIFISIFHSVFFYISVVWFLAISLPHPSFARQLAQSVLRIHSTISPSSSSVKFFPFCRSSKFIYSICVFPSSVHSLWYEDCCILYDLLY